MRRLYADITELFLRQRVMSADKETLLSIVKSWRKAGQIRSGLIRKESIHLFYLMMMEKYILHLQDWIRQERPVF